MNVLSKILSRFRRQSEPGSRIFACATGRYKITYGGGGRIKTVRAIKNSKRYQTVRGFIAANRPALRRAGFDV